MTTPYAALLSVRQIEEQQAEMVLAVALGALAAVKKMLEQVTAARTAWLAGEIEAGMAELMRDLEEAQREAEQRVAVAEREAGLAREALIERRRAREVVEKLHLETLAAAARAGARRAQHELDEIGSRSVGAFREGAR